jgi:hypothetical protein
MIKLVYVALGLGAATRLGCGWGPYSQNVSGAGDVNGDGNADLVGINGNNHCLYRWYGNGSGGFGAAMQVLCGLQYFSQVTGLGDFDGDGIGDLVAMAAQTSGTR